MSRDLNLRGPGFFLISAFFLSSEYPEDFLSQGSGFFRGMRCPEKEPPLRHQPLLSELEIFLKFPEKTQ